MPGNCPGKAGHLAARRPPLKKVEISLPKPLTYGECAFTTVQTLLRIMSDKGLVSQRNEGRTLFYAAKYSPESASSRFLHKVFDGALDKMVLSMLQAEDVTAEEMAELERMIARARKEKQNPGGSKSKDEGSASNATQ